MIVKLKKIQSFSYQFNIHVGSILGVLLFISSQYMVQFWSNFGPHVTPWRWQKSGKKNPILKKLIIELSKYIKAKSPLPYLGKLGHFLHFWGKNRWAPQVKSSESKFNAAYFTQMVVDLLNPPKFWFQHFPVLRLYVPNDCKFGCSSGNHVDICKRKWSIKPGAEFNSKWIGTNLKSQK